MKNPGLLFSLLVASVALADEPAPKKTLFFFAQGNPAGLAFQYDLELPWRGDLLVGVNYADYVYTGAGELSLRYHYLGGLIDLLAGVGAEGGTYYQMAPGQPLPGSYDDTTRLPGVKDFARFEGKLNLKLDRFWLYARISPTLRLRSYNELDVRRALVVRNEASVGDAVALIFRAWGEPGPKPETGWNREGWLYLEYTRESVFARASADGVVAADTKSIAISRPSVGAIGYAPFGWERVTYDLDLYYSLVDRNIFTASERENLKGFGAQLFVWVDY